MNGFPPTGPLPRQSLALEASAGTGKTWMLASLVARYVAETPVELGELLVVTFTRAASAELRERVRSRLGESLAVCERVLAGEPVTTSDVVLAHIAGLDVEQAGTSAAPAGRAPEPGGAPTPEPAPTPGGAPTPGRVEASEIVRRRDRLRTALGQLDDATITTIHGFCQRMLQHAALETGVDFDAQLLEDDTDLLTEIVDDHLARELRPAGPEWVRYLRQVAGLDGSRLLELARTVGGMPTLRLLPEPDPADHHDGPGTDTAAWISALEVFRDCWTDGGRETAVEVIDLLERDGAFGSRQRTFTAATAAECAAQVDAWLQDHRPVPPGRVSGRDRHRDPSYPMAFFTRAALAEKLVGEPGPLGDADAVVDACERLLATVNAPATLFLHRTAVHLHHELERRTRQRAVLTFDDVLRRLADALGDPATRTAARSAIRQRYRAALIDEFQDTDAVQWRIFDALFGPDEPLVLVGDPKQAIYAFRGADVHTYVRARDSRPLTGTLTTNHRSDAGYVRACNTLFGQPAAFATGDIPYRPVEARHPDRLHDPAGDAPLRVRFVPRSAGEIGQRGRGRGMLTKGWADRTLPADVAGEVVRLLEAGIRIGSGDPHDAGTRSLAPRDIAVLVRTNLRAEAVREQLRAAGVPAVIQRGGSVFATAEAEAIERLLVAMLRPGVERTAVTAAASILFAHDAATLIAQRTPGDTPEAPGEWDDWMEVLAEGGVRWHRHGVLTALRAVLAHERVHERLLAHEGGERSVTNLRHLLELLHDAESTGRATPNSVLEWLRSRRAHAIDGERPTVESELRLEEDAEAVRVVTVHGSKGLQYPVVLCPDLWDGRIRIDESFTRFHDPEADDPHGAITLDVGQDLSDEGKRRSIGLATRQERAEEVRLAYVALTRAQHRCIVWWGAFTDAPTSALASLFHGGDQADPEGRLDHAERQLTRPDESLLEELHALASPSEGAIDVVVAGNPGQGAQWSAPPRTEPILDARVFTRGDVDRSWQRTSFTALVARAHDPAGPAGGATSDADDRGRDVDALDGPAVGVPSVTSPIGRDADEATASGHAIGAGDQVPLASFPRGAGPGTFLHDVLERLDFTETGDLPLGGLVDGLLPRHGIDRSHRTTVIEGIRAAVATPLGTVTGGAALADLAPADRLDELRFELPLAGGFAAPGTSVTLAAVAELLEDAGDAGGELLRGHAPRLRDPALVGGVRGFLNGSIDLLARLPDGRYLVADYKSNWLGAPETARSTARDYRPSVLTAAMHGHHYVLQALLYLVAAHRYLRWRVPGYAYDTHVAGAAYLFLRGMVGRDTPQADGGTCGIAVMQPAGEVIEAVSRLLDRGAE